jgi:hypothetical protein
MNKLDLYEMTRRHCGEETRMGDSAVEGPQSDFQKLFSKRHAIDTNPAVARLGGSPPRSATFS